jgi:hypothetical protein
LHHWSLEKTLLHTVTMKASIHICRKNRSIIITCIFWHKILIFVLSIMTHLHLSKIFIVKCIYSCKILKYFKHLISGENTKKGSKWRWESSDVTVSFTSLVFKVNVNMVWKCFSNRVCTLGQFSQYSIISKVKATLTTRHPLSAKVGIC